MIGKALLLALMLLPHHHPVCKWGGTVTGGQKPNSPIVITITNPCYPGKPIPVGRGRVTIP